MKTTDRVMGLRGCASARSAAANARAGAMFPAKRTAMLVGTMSLVAVAVAACGASAPAAQDGGADGASVPPQEASVDVERQPDGAAEPDSASLGCAEYPIAYPIAPDSQQVGEGALAKLSQANASEPSMTWNPTLGTLRKINNLDVPLVGCDGSTLVSDSIRQELIEAWPDLFNIDAKEWIVIRDLPCEEVTAEEQVVHFGRPTIGEQPSGGGHIKFYVVREGGAVIVHRLHGGYLPPTPTNVGKLLSRCTFPDPDAFLATLRAREYPYLILRRCRPQGEGTYSPQTDDVFRFDPPVWRYTIKDGEILLHAERPALLIVAAHHHTDDLEHSDAYCPPEVGWSITIDALTGEVYVSGPGVGCLVC